MATPRTLKLPPQMNGRGGALLTSADEQGVEAIEQLLILGILGRRRTLNPWLQTTASPVGALFAADLARARIDIEAHVRQVFAQLEAREFARFGGLTVRRDDSSGSEGQVVVEIRWFNLRVSGGDRQQHTTRVAMGS